MKNLSFKKYRGTEKGHFKIPWMFYDNIPQWLQNHQQEVFKRELSLAECEAAVRRMQQISDTARRAGNYDQIIIKHDAATDRWASYGTAEDRVILEAKGRIKTGSHADRMRGIEACSRSQMLEHIKERYGCSDKEAARLFHALKNNDQIRFDSKRDGYGDTWRSWDVRQKAPTRTTREAMLSGTRCDEYRKLVAGINKKRHSYKEPLESSEFLQALNARVLETGFSLDIKEGQSRFAALDALRNRIWNVTKQEELKPLTGLRQPDGSWLLSAQTEQPVEVEIKKVRKLLTIDDINFVEFYEWQAARPNENGFYDKAMAHWNTSDEVITDLMCQVKKVDEQIAKQKKEEQERKEKEAWIKVKDEVREKTKEALGNRHGAYIVLQAAWFHTDRDGKVNREKFLQSVEEKVSRDPKWTQDMMQALAGVVNFNGS